MKNVDEDGVFLGGKWWWVVTKMGEDRLWIASVLGEEMKGVRRRAKTLKGAKYNIADTIEAILGAKGH
ncbi:hypothetical protein LCGC14_1766130 [marine sediment metagenome]|uniref:Uncharacterized protein n=1 Tax=marine sediment metagenome TaxID=412755 RepID=A0A0F9GZM4_9ZZZZ